MGTSVAFNNFRNSMEQQLIEDLVVESIKIYGHDVFYLPRTILNSDSVLSEPENVSFGVALPVEMYIRNVDGFEGEGDFLSKFGLQIKDSLTLTVSRRSFGHHIQAVRSDRPRPFEGDAVYFPLTRKLYGIKFVEHESIFYQMGALQVWDLKLELFEYSNETFDTGIPEIDNKYNALRQNIGNTAPEDVILNDPLAQNETFEGTANTVIDFSEINPFSEGPY